MYEQVLLKPVFRNSLCVGLVDETIGREIKPLLDVKISEVKPEGKSVKTRRLHRNLLLQCNKLRITDRPDSRKKKLRHSLQKKDEVPVIPCQCEQDSSD